MKPYRLLYDPTQCALYSSCILSAGLDTKATLWAVPEPDKLDEHMGTDKPAMVHYPHFSTMEVYTDFFNTVSNGTTISSSAMRAKKARSSSGKLMGV